MILSVNDQLYSRLNSDAEQSTKDLYLVEENTKLHLHIHTSFLYRYLTMVQKPERSPHIFKNPKKLLQNFLTIKSGMVYILSIVPCKHQTKFKKSSKYDSIINITPKVIKKVQKRIWKAILKTGYLPAY